MTSYVDRYGNVHHPAMRLKVRKHKGMAFKPHPDATNKSKRMINKILTEKRAGIDGRICDKFYYRIYKHKGQLYTLYIGNNKQSHGGLRHKPPVRGSAAAHKLRKQNIQRTANSERGRIDISNYDRIQTGIHAGKIRNKTTNRILTDEQFRMLIQERGGK